MDRLITPNGGMPLELDDLVFIQNAFKGALKGILHEVSKQNAGNLILSGCEVTDLGGGNYSLSEGYVMLGYEVCYVPAVPSVNHVIAAIVLDISYNSVGNDVFFDGISRDTYEIRQGKPYVPSTTLTNPHVTLSDEFRLTTLLPKAMKNKWALIDFVGEKYVFQTSDFKNGATANTSFPPYAIKKNGVVRFYGSVNIPSGISPGTDVLEVPTAFRKGITTVAGLGDVYNCSYGNSIVRFGVGASHLRYLDVAVIGNNNGNGVSLNQIVYDIENI